MTGISKFQGFYPGTILGAPPAAHSHTESDVVSLIGDLSGKQPLDSDLTAIAALATTSYGRALLTLANQAAFTATNANGTETLPGILELATQAETNTGTDDARAVTPLKMATRLAAAYQPLDSDLTAVAALATTSYGRALLTLADQAALTAANALGTETLPGILEVATQAETNTGTDDTRAVTPLKFQTRLAAYAQPLDSDLTAFAAKTAPSGAVVGTTDTQALTNKDLTGAGNTFPSSLAVDSAVVHKATAETITGVKTLDVPTVQTYQGSAPATPAAGKATGPYFGSDGLPYFLTPTGVVVPISIGEIGSALHTNASFETVSGSTPTVWDTFWNSGGSFTTETTDVLFGARSATVATTAGANYQFLMSDVFTVAAGDSVSVGAWAHLVTGNPVLQIGLLSIASGTPNFFDGLSASQSSDFITLAATFTKYSKTFLVPAGHTVARLYLRFSPSASEATSSRVDFTTSSRTGASTSTLPGNAWVKEVCRLATTSAVTNPLTAAPNSVDGVTPAVGDRILNTGSHAKCGLWTVVTVGTGSNGVWARTADAATAAQLAGAEVAITAGTANAGTRWTTTWKSADTLDTTAMTWTKAVSSGDTTDLTIAAGGVGTGTFRDSVDARVTAVGPTLTMTTGGVGTGAFRDSVDARVTAVVGAAWTAYTPTWSGTLGNGTLVGKWIRVDKLVHYRIKLIWGSTTSHAATTQSFVLPTAAHADYVANIHMGNGLALDNSAVAFNNLTAGWLSSTSVFVLGTANTSISNLIPWTWAVSDKLSLSGTYETA